MLPPLLLRSQAKDMPASLQLVGKLGGPGRLNAVTAGQLIHMLGQTSNRRFLVDTSASYSILPHCSSLPATGPKLIPCWGDLLMQLRFQDQDFSWKFLLADVAFPILGVDFLSAHKLLIDPVGHALLDSTGRRIAGQLRCSLPTAMVVIGFVQPYNPMAQPLPEHPAPEQPAPEQPAPEQPAPDQPLPPMRGQPRQRRM